VRWAVRGAGPSAYRSRSASTPRGRLRGDYSAAGGAFRCGVSCCRAEALVWVGLAGPGFLAEGAAASRRFPWERAAAGKEKLRRGVLDDSNLFSAQSAPLPGPVGLPRKCPDITISTFQAEGKIRL